MSRFDPLYEEACILAWGTPTSEYRRAFQNARCILEEAASPITRKHQEKLFKSVIEKGHIRFDDIEKSAGNIADYTGYGNMVSILDTIDQLATDQKADKVKTYTGIVKSAIGYIRDLSATFQRGFQTKCEYAMLEYNTYVYCCVEATSSLIYEFVDYIKRPDKSTMTIQLKNTTVRANLFYFQQLMKFNRVQEEMGMDYRKMLESMMQKGRENFIGIDTAIGIGAITLVAAAIVPITREIVYQVYNTRKNLSLELEQQAMFLEMNKIAVQNNDNLDPAQKKKVLDKQQKLAQQLRRLSSKLRVDAVTATKKGQKDLESDNKEMTMAKTKEDIENSPITLF